MLVRIQQTVAPATPLVTPQLAQQHTRIDSNVDNNLLAIYIETATQLCESYLNRSLITQTICQTFAHTFPPVSFPYVFVPFAAMPIGYEFLIEQLDQHTIDLFYGTVQAVQSITRTDWYGNSTTLVLGTDYTLDLNLEPARLRMCSAVNWNAVASFQATYTAGYGDTPAQVPTPIIHAVLLTTAKLYEARGDGEDAAALSPAAKSLLDRYRQPTFGLGC